MSNNGRNELEDKNQCDIIINNTVHYFSMNTAVFL